jgi:hypothetical protein
MLSAAGPLLALPLLFGVAAVPTAARAQIPAEHSFWGGPDSPGGLFGGDPMDADQDGNRQVSPGEFNAWLRRRVTGAGAGRDGGLAPQELGIRPGDRRRQAWFRAADANGDGRLTQDELESLAGLTFRFHDTNRDGTLQPQEVRRAATPRRQGGGGGGQPGPAAGGGGGAAQ